MKKTILINNIKIKFKKIIILKDNKIASCTEDGFIYIYLYNHYKKETSDNKNSSKNNNTEFFNRKNDIGLYYYNYNIWGSFQREENLFNNYNKIKSNNNLCFACIKVTDCGAALDILEMSDGNIISCGEDGSVNITKVTKQNAFYINGGAPTNSSMNKIIKLSDDNFLICSNDGHLYYYKYKSKEEALDIIKITYLGGNILTFYQYNTNEYLLGTCERRNNLEKYFLKFYDNNQLTTLIELEKIYIGQTFEKINDNYIIFSQQSKIMIFNLKNHSFSFINNLNELLTTINVFLKINDKVLLGGDQNGFIYEFEIKNNTVSLKNKIKAHDNLITSDMIKYDDKNIITCGYDGKIIRWKLE